MHSFTDSTDNNLLMCTFPSPLQEKPLMFVFHLQINAELGLSLYACLDEVMYQALINSGMCHELICCHQRNE